MRRHVSRQSSRLSKESLLAFEVAIVLTSICVTLGVFRDLPRTAWISTSLITACEMSVFPIWAFLKYANVAFPTKAGEAMWIAAGIQPYFVIFRTVGVLGSYVSVAFQVFILLRFIALAWSLTIARPFGKRWTTILTLFAFCSLFQVLSVCLGIGGLVAKGVTAPSLLAIVIGLLALALWGWDFKTGKRIEWMHTLGIMLLVLQMV